MNFAEAAGWLSGRDKFLIITHCRPDGDTLGSAGGLCQALRDMGKTAYILENPETIERYMEFVEPYYSPEGYAPETVVAVDTAGENLFPLNIGQYAGRIDLAIDHHGSHRSYAKESCVDGSYASCGEMIYKILLDCGVRITTNIATMLYLAIVTDTGCFRYSNTNPTTLRICAELMECGVPVSYINKKFFRTKSRARVMLESHMLKDVALYDDGLIGIVCVTKELKEKVGATENDTDDIASVVGQIEGVRVSVTISELDAGGCKISVRTWPDLNASDVCAVLGGGGHKAAAGCTVDAGIEEAKELIVGAIRQVMRKSAASAKA